MPYVSCGTLPSVSALLPAANDFHYLSAPRERAQSAAQSIMSVVPSGQQIVRKSDVKLESERTITPEEEQLGLLVEVDERFCDSGGLPGDQQVNDDLERS